MGTGSFLHAQAARWLVTGSAGFIGSHLLEHLLRHGQEVVSVDNFSTGHRRNLEQVRRAVGDEAWSRHEFLEGDIGDRSLMRRACKGVAGILHQAALGSVPRSIADPLATHASNATGFVTLLDAARQAGVRRFVYASSSSVYGDSPDLPKIEERIGRPLSPYAASKLTNELYADAFARCYGMQIAGLRYFNVFGPRQDPDGPYAAVIPRWIKAMLRGEAVVIFGDGETSRDFCYVANAVQANIRAATVDQSNGVARIYNVAVGARTTLKELHAILRACVGARRHNLRIGDPIEQPFRPGDVRHSQADIARARADLGYEPTHDVRRGLEEALEWYLTQYELLGRSLPPETADARRG